MIKPPKFENRQSIGIVNFSGAINAEGLKKFVDFVTNEIGIRVYIPDSITYVHDEKYFGNFDVRKSVDEFYELLQNPEIGLILASCGGFGAQRIANMLDLEIIRDYPKIVCGLSDITVILNHITSNAGITSVLGITAELHSKEHKKMLLDLFDIITGNIEIPYKFYSDNFIRRLSYSDKERVVSGKGIGGNLTMLETMSGTKYDVNYYNTVLFLEDVAETSYDTLRRLIHFDHMGIFDQVEAVIIGKFDYTESMAKGEYVQDYVSSPSMVECLSSFFKDKDIPVLYGYPFSHNKGYNITIPLGVEYIVDYKNRELLLMELPVEI